MFIHETITAVYTCPNCGATLTSGDSGALLCGEHGVFFAYGPQLLVRAPQPEERFPDRAMPWERERVDDEDER